MSDSLQIYLHDHLAGSNFAIELLKSLCEQNGNDSLARFAASLLLEIQTDVDLLRAIIEQVGKSHLDMKEIVAWLAEKASRFKLEHESTGGLGTFEALETLGLGIMGKLALWRVLPLIAEVDARVPRMDFDKLAVSAQNQYARVEQFRLQMAHSAFRRS
jgi:hypothetical protein